MIKNIFKKIGEFFKNVFKDKIFTYVFTFGVFLFLGFLVISTSFKTGLNNISVLTNAQGITVSGTSERYVTSDRGSISINLSVDNSNLSDTLAVKSITDARDSLVKYLTNYGIEAKDIDVLSMNSVPSCTLRDKNSWDTCLGKKYNMYNLTINLASNDVNKIKDLSLNINNYVNNNLSSYFSNVNLSVNSTQYLYTKLSDIKSEMLNEATKNAFDRAEAIAKSTGNNAGSVITASQGVFQITSKDSTDSSDYGVYDTATIDKKITAVVRVSFKVK